MTHRPTKRYLSVAAAAVMSTAALSGCLSSGTSSGGSDSSAGGGTGPCAGVTAGSVDSSALKGVTVKVGSKDFDEQLVLGQLTLKMMCAAGAKAVDVTNSQGSTQARDKLIKGGSDVYWDYTGTGWVNYLANDKPITDPVKQYDAVKKADLAKNGLVWGTRSPFNNTYAFATTAKFAKQNNLTDDSGMAAYIKKNPGASVCVESEFAGRPDGYPGFKKAYGITGGQLKSLGTGVVYTQLSKGNCDFGEIFTTDGRIKALNLFTLKDDKAFFPVYNGVPIVTKKTEKAHPEILQVLAPLAKGLSTANMLAMNTQVSAQGLPVDKVAEDYLKKEGFLK